MPDNVIKLIVWIIIGVISTFIAYYIILHNTFTLIATIVWSMLLVLYIVFRYSKVDTTDREIKNRSDP